MMNISRNGITAAALVVAATHLGAQEMPTVASWSVMASAGFAYGTSVEGVERAMKSAGFDAQGCSLCDGASPNSERWGLSLQVAARRSLGDTRHVRVLLAHSSTGVSHGAKVGGRLFEDDVDLVPSVSTFAILGGVNESSDPALWFAAGPAIHRVQLEQRQSGGGPPQSAYRLGGVVAIGTGGTRNGRELIDVQVQYRHVGTVDMGPIDVPAVPGGSAGRLPRTPINFNHVLVLLGFGVRL